MAKQIVPLFKHFDRNYRLIMKERFFFFLHFVWSSFFTRNTGDTLLEFEWHNLSVTFDWHHMHWNKNMLIMSGTYQPNEQQSEKEQQKKKERNARSAVLKLFLHGGRTVLLLSKVCVMGQWLMECIAHGIRDLSACRLLLNGLCTFFCVLPSSRTLANAFADLFSSKLRILYDMSS